ncbi:MAG: hypothetical protein KL787_01560 [Taibaiella sp.]|nr:hypothetical protein [Taibaiella sp.]
MRKLLIIIIIPAMFIACNKGGNVPPGVTNVPLLTDLSVSSDEFHFMDTAGKVLVNFTIWDKDKDFGSEMRDTSVVVQDIRSGEVYRTLVLPMPEIPRDILDKDYLQANVTIPLKSVLFTPRSDTLHTRERKDTLTLNIWVIDEAGHQSNILNTDTFYISD